MKAQARKILALIMAMVMCLSLAAPAFAEAEEAAEASAPVVETEAPEAEDDAEDGELAAQAIVNVYVFDAGDGSGNYDIKAGSGTVVASGNVVGTNPTGATVTLIDGGNTLIGEAPAEKKYKVKYSAVANVNDTYSTTDDNDLTKNIVTVASSSSEGTKTIENVVDQMLPLEGAKATFKVSSTTYQVQGSYYEEANSDGTVNVYFRLAKYDTKTKNFDDSEKFDFVAKKHAAINGDNSKLADALQKAAKCNIYGEVPDTSDTVSANKHSVLKTTTSTTAATTEFTVEVLNKVDVAGTFGTKKSSDKPTMDVFNGKATCSVNSGKTTGSFQVRIQNVTGTDDTKWFYVTDATTVETMVKEALVGQKVTVESVVAANDINTYWTVTVKAKDDAAAVSSTQWTKNVASYGTDAVLIDASKDGWYNGTDGKGTDSVAVSAGETTGPVVVRKSDLPSGVTTSCTLTGGKYYLFSNAAAMKGQFTVSSCKNGGSVPYVELKMNPIINGKKNTLVTVTRDGYVEDTGANAGKFVAVANAPVNTLQDLATIAANATDRNTTGLSAGDTFDHDRLTYTVAADMTTGKEWYTYAYDTPNAAFVNKGSIEVKVEKHTGNLVEVTTQKDATCQEKGSKTVKTVCDECNQVVSEKTTEIPVISDPVEKNVPNDPTKWAFTTTKGTTNHYYAKQEDVTTTDPATGEITVETTYYCNFGVAHEKKTTTYKKTDLQHSGTWDMVTLDKYTAFELWNGTAASKMGLVKSVTVVDPDVEFTTIPMNRTTDAYFHFDVTTLGTSTDANGNYVVYQDLCIPAGTGTVTGIPVYATATGVATTKYYAAQLTISDINVGATKCDDSSCTVSVDVYAIDKKTAEALTGGATPVSLINSAAALEKNLKDKKVTLVKNYSEKVTVAGLGHKYFNDDGEATALCTRCGTPKPADTDAVNVIDPANVVVKDLTWTGKVAQPKVIITDAKGFTLIEGRDFVRSEINETAVGEYSVTIRGENEYKGNDFVKTFKINKAKATLKKKSAPKTLTANKKKAVTGQIKMTVKGGKVAKYKVTGKVAGVSVNKSGKITVKKANKKAGTLKVKVTMTPDANHTAAKAVTVKVAIKAAKK